MIIDVYYWWLLFIIDNYLWLFVIILIYFNMLI